MKKRTISGKRLKKLSLTARVGKSKRVEILINIRRARRICARITPVRTIARVLTFCGEIGHFSRGAR